MEHTKTARLLRWVAVACAVILLFVGVFEFDLTGVEKRVPAPEDAELVSLSGMGEIAEVFPNAKCYAPAPVVTLYAHQYQPKLDEWTEIIGEQNLCRKQCDRLEELPGTFIELEGEKLEVIRCMGDLMWNTIVWIPSIKTVVCSDVVFNDAHPFTCEVNEEQRKLWIKDIEGIYDLQPDVVIPGHMREGTLLDESGLMVWLVTSDGAGYKTVQAYDIAPHQTAPAPDYGGLENRIKRLEEIVNGYTGNSSAAGEKQHGPAGATRAADDEHGSRYARPGGYTLPAWQKSESRTAACRVRESRLPQRAKSKDVCAVYRLNR